jgi:mitochondrial fission protein ELM1
VRIFLGSEPAQQRAERVFVWSVLRARDPSRAYEIWLMKGLAGFRRRGGATGFENYRFAVPHFAGGAGRAIYNDVDQLYLADPAELFDLPMGDHGVLTVGPDDLSVMLVDCERTAGLWTLQSAQREDRARLLRRMAQAPKLVGALAPEWMAHDDEYVAERSKLLRYTTLHTQPWRPHPERFVYQQSAEARLWHDFEREADAANFQIFTRERPSALYRTRGSPQRLEDLPSDDLPWFLDEMFSRALGSVRAEIRCDPPTPSALAQDPSGETRRSARWWTERFEEAGVRHPSVRWSITLHQPGSRAERRREGGPPAHGQTPSVWVLTDDRPGNRTQSIGLAEALDWPYEIKFVHPGVFSLLHNRLLGASRIGIVAARSAPLEPPWPDLVIAAGRRTAPVAQWIREQSEGRTRLVQLGRKGADAAELFDLAVTPAYCRLFPHPRRIETYAPLHSVSSERLADAADRWGGALGVLPSPRIAVLVGGTSGQYRLDARTARRLGEDVARMARERGGSVIATTSRRTGRAASAAFCSALPERSLVYRAGDPGENPYLGFLALADAFVITGDTESMLAEAISTGRPVFIYPLAQRPSFGVLRLFRDWVLQRARGRAAGPRATARPQRGLERLCARLIDRGLVRPTRDLERLHQDLVMRGMAHRFGDREIDRPRRQRSDTAVVVDRIRALLGVT